MPDIVPLTLIPSLTLTERCGPTLAVSARASSAHVRVSEGEQFRALPPKKVSLPTERDAKERFLSLVSHRYSCGLHEVST